jgi:hypothetical protein
MSDIMFDPDMCRNISIDIRYALFINDKFAGAGYLLERWKLWNSVGEPLFNRCLIFVLFVLSKFCMPNSIAHYICLV